MVRALLSDARSAGIPRVRFYGGEPLLHPDLPEMIREATALGLNVYVTTNGVLLSKRMSDLYSAGLREITLGFYGVGVAYDRYVGRRGAFRVLETGVRAVRERYGDSVRMGLNWLLTRESCTPAALAAACEFADAHDLQVQVDLIHYSLPYLSEGPDRRLQFKREDELKIRAVIADLLRRKRSNPGRFCQSLAGLSSIPDWLLLQSRMRIPCHSHQLLWVGADGSVQLCYAGFSLGNLCQQSLSSICARPSISIRERDVNVAAIPPRQ
jgi:MoaA/NifB/PqqE/SkfB family radical SAM enzyme